MAGETESRIYSLASGKELNEGGRDYNTRFCDMTTDGGGWTVSDGLPSFLHHLAMAKRVTFVGANKSWIIDDRSIRLLRENPKRRKGVQAMGTGGDAQLEPNCAVRVTSCSLRNWRCESYPSLKGACAR